MTFSLFAFALIVIQKIIQFLYLLYFSYFGGLLTGGLLSLICLLDRQQETGEFVCHEALVHQSIEAEQKDIMAQTGEQNEVMQSSVMDLSHMVREGEELTQQLRQLIDVIEEKTKQKKENEASNCSEIKVVSEDLKEIIGSCKIALLNLGSIKTLSVLIEKIDQNNNRLEQLLSQHHALDVERVPVCPM